MPKTPDEIMKGLECDPLALIRQLHADNCRLTDELYNAYNVQNEQLVRINQLEAERDAALKCIKDVCGCMACNSARVSKLDSPCRECICDGMATYDYWLWRGVQKEESEDGKE